VRGAVIGSQDSPLIWMDRVGRVTPAEPATGGPRGGRLWTRISPDRSHLALTVQTPIRRETYLLDWTRDLWAACESCISAFGAAVWSPDGRRLAINRKSALVVRAVDGSAPDEELIHEDGHIVLPIQWLPDGRILYATTLDFARMETKLLDPTSRAQRVVIPM